MTSSSLGITITLNYLAKEDVNAMNCKMKIIQILPLIQRLEIISFIHIPFRTLSQWKSFDIKYELLKIETRKVFILMCLCHKTHYSPKTKQPFTGEQVFAVSILNLFPECLKPSSFQSTETQETGQRHKEVIISNNMQKSVTLINRTKCADYDHHVTLDS